MSHLVTVHWHARFIRSIGAGYPAVTSQDINPSNIVMWRRGQRRCEGWLRVREGSSLGASLRDLQQKIDCPEGEFACAFEDGNTITISSVTILFATVGRVRYQLSQCYGRTQWLFGLSLGLGWDRLRMEVVNVRHNP